MPMIFKILRRSEWTEAQTAGVFTGSAIDLRDGYIHFSTGEQAPETARLHFRDVADLVVLAVDTAVLGDALKWEPSRGGALFPHLYGTLSTQHIVSVNEAPLNADGIPILTAQ